MAAYVIKYPRRKKNGKTVKLFVHVGVITD